jgi:recombination protein RecA
MQPEFLPHIPTGTPKLDQLIGGATDAERIYKCPGVPRGRVTQMWGVPESGKTTLCLKLAATCIEHGGTVVYIDFHNGFLPDYANSLGVPTDEDSKFILLQPENLDDAITAAVTCAREGVDLVIFDGLESGWPQQAKNEWKAQLDTQRDEEPPHQAFNMAGPIHQMWAQELPLLKQLADKTNTAVVGTVSVRSPGDPPLGETSQKTTGVGWQFYTSVRMELSPTNTPGIIVAKMVKSMVSRTQGQEVLINLAGSEPTSPT